MSSTGEVGCLGEIFTEAILKAMISVGYTILKKNTYIFERIAVKSRPHGSV